MLSLDVQSEKLEGIDKYEDAEVLDSTSTGRCQFYLFILFGLFFPYLPMVRFSCM
jgi:hypothetical protein